MTSETQSTPRLGISACLLGEAVRYDGGHKRDPFLVETFGRHVEWVPVCPEVECGLPVPREPMHLRGDPAAPRLVAGRSRADHTCRMLRWAGRRLAELKGEGLWGFVFKAGSPSCGMGRLRVHRRDGAPRGTGVGLFAREFVRRFPLLPVEDEVRLHDPGVRDNFIERIFCLKRYRDSVAQRRSVRALAGFHADHKVLFMAHGAEHARRLGRLAAR